MQRRIFGGCALLFFTAIWPAKLYAQFQAPTNEELKMSSDPKAPGAAAVYLYREDVADNPGHVHSYYVRIKVLTEKGKELATVRLPFQRGESKVAVLRGRTIHSNGAVISLDAKPEELADLKSKYYQGNTLVFTLPGVEVGSILEYRLEFRYDNDVVFLPSWNIQQPYFVHKAHYSFRRGQDSVTDSLGATLDQLTWAATSKVIDVHQVKDSYVVDLSDIPPIPDEDWMPPLNTIVWRVSFYYTNGSSREDFWKSEGDRWAAEAAPPKNALDSLKTVAASLVSAHDSDEVKARKIYAAVMKLDNTDYSPGTTEAERQQEKLKAPAAAEDVWKLQSGSANEIALLYVALAQAAGLEAWPMKVVNRGRALFDVNYLNMSQLSDVVVVAGIGGKDVYLDPGEKMCPFGSLSWEHELASGLRASATGSAITATPAATFKQNLMQREAELDLDEQGNLSGTARYRMTGSAALYWRQFALEYDETELKDQFKKAIQGDLPQGVHAEVNYFLGLDDYEGDLTAVVDVSGAMGFSAGSQVNLPGLFFEAGAKHPFVTEDKRTAPIDLHYAEQEQDDVSYQLPAGFSVEGALSTADITWTDNALLHIDSAAENNMLEITRTFASNIILLSPDDYASLHDFYKKVATADQQQIVLARPDAVKGN